MDVCMKFMYVCMDGCMDVCMEVMKKDRIKENSKLIICICSMCMLY